MSLVVPVFCAWGTYQHKFCTVKIKSFSVHKIIEAKGATYYGIGMSIVRIVRAILQDENSVLTVSVRLRGEYGGKKDVFIGNPCIVSANGAKRILELKLTEQELQKLDNSCTILNDNFKKLKL